MPTEPSLTDALYAYATEATYDGSFFYQKSDPSGSKQTSAGYAPMAKQSANRTPYFNETVVGAELVVQVTDSYEPEATQYQTPYFTNYNRNSYYKPATADPSLQPPGVPRPIQIGATGMSFAFYDTNNPENTDNTYSVEIGLGQTDFDSDPSTQVNPSLRIYTSTFTGLTASTNYYARSKLSNGTSTVYSAIVGPFTTAGGTPGVPSGPPTVPIPNIVLSTSMSVFFDTAGITGNPLPNYRILWGTSTTPSTVASALLVPGTTTRSCSLTGLTPGTTYYFKSVAYNNVGEVDSVVSPGYATPSGSGTAPSKAPTVPAVSGTPTSTSITVSFDVAGITGTPTPAYSVLYGTPSATISAPAQLTTGTIYSAVVSNLLPGTQYFFKSVASNNAGTISSSSSGPISTASGGQGPKNPPTVPVVVGTPTSSSITVSFSATNVGGLPAPTISALYGTSTAPSTPLFATLQGDGTYLATATGLTPSTAYYFVSVASNPSGTLRSNASASISTGATGSATVPTLCIITFLLNNGNGWVIDTGYNTVFGNWSLDGPNAGQIQGPTKDYVTGRIKTLQASGAKVLVSLGGAVASLPTMFAGGGVAFAQSFAYAFFGGTQNPLNWSNNWNGIRWDGFDLDIESNTPLPSDLRTFVQAFRASASNPNSVIITCAGVQQPNIISVNPGAVNANGPGAPYATVTASTPNLTTGYVGDNADAIINVGGMTAIRPTFIFSQIYNQGDGWYIGQSAFNRSCAMYGYMCLKAGVGTKFMIGVASDDGTPIFSNADATALSTALTAINTIITSETSFTTAVVSDWCAGVGFWTSPTANSVASAVWSNGAGSVAGLPATGTMLFLSQKGNADPQWGPGTVPVPNTATSTPTAPNQAPTVPALSGTAGTTTMTITFSTSGITGTAPLAYSLLYGTTNPPTQSAPPLTINGSTATANLTGLTSGTTYFFRSRVSNAGGALLSAVSAGIPTSSGGSPPSGPPSAPVLLGTPTSTVIAVTVDTTGIVGIPTPTYSLLYGTSFANPSTPFPLTQRVVGGVPVPYTYDAYITGLTPETTYYITSVATNSAGTRKWPTPITASTVASPAPSATPPLAPFLYTAPGSTIAFIVSDFTPCGTFVDGQQPTIGVGTTSVYQGTLQPGILIKIPGNASTKLYYCECPFPPKTSFFASAFLSPQGAISPVSSLTN